MTVRDDHGLQEEVDYAAERLEDYAEGLVMIDCWGWPVDEDDAEAMEDAGKCDMLDYLRVEAIEIETVHKLGNARDDAYDTYCGCRVMVTVGGPTIWVDTQTRTVRGTWCPYAAEARISEEACCELEEAVKTLKFC